MDVKLKSFHKIIYKENGRWKGLTYKYEGSIGLSQIINDVKEKIISDFDNIKDRIILQMEGRYGRNAKGMEYLRKLFEKEFGQYMDLGVGKK